MKRLSLLALLLVAACAPKPGQTRVQTALAALHDPSSKYVVVVAHRGDWRNYPENSIPAIESCIRMGVDMMELDLKLTKDSVLVLSHDHTLNRCTTGSGRISDYTYEEILQFDLKAGHGIGRPGIKMPTLREALEVCKDRILVNVDQGYDYYDQVLAITEELGVTDQILIKSGKSLSEVKAKLEEHPHNMMYMPVVTAAAAEKMGAFNDYIAADEPLMAYELCFGELNDDVRTAAKRILDDGSKLWVNTIWASLCGGYEDDAADKADNPDTVYGPILDLGASILQTDRPQLLISYLESKGRHSLLR
ncbi:MAG: glycerophosphodiester phosphodiesterase family protein [Bacteroidales bacterium]|nr:glycerophosphodiester phosphodiesterase family protein [Bacteroidales bacterium]